MKRLLIVFVFLFFGIFSFAQDLGVQYVKSIKGTSSSDISDLNVVKVNANGTMFVAGAFRGTVDFDPDPGNTVNRTSNGSDWDIFIAKYNSDGELPNSTSVITSGDVSSQYITDLVISGQSFYVTGVVAGSSSFATGVALPANTVVSNGNIDILIAKFDEGLTNIWAHTIGGASIDFGSGIAVDNSGNLYITGEFQGTANFDPSGSGTAKTLTAPGSNGDIFIAKYNPDGELIWAHNIGGNFADAGYALEIDQSNNIYVTGTFNGSVDFDPGPGTTTIQSNPTVKSVFIAKYTSAGNLVWAKSIIGAETASDLSINSSGDIAITGYFQVNNSDFDPGPGEALLPYTDNLPDGYVAVYDNSGNYKWAKSIGGPNSSLEIPERVAFAADGSVLVSGGGGGDIDFNQQGSTPYILTSVSSDAFIARYLADGTLDYAYLFGGTGADYGSYLTLDEGNLISYGRIRSPSIDFDPGSGSAILNSSSMDDSYMVKYDFTPPTLVSNNTATPELGSDLLVSIVLADPESGVAGAVLDYRPISSSATFSRVTLTKKSGNTFEGTVPSDAFGELGMEFRGVATNTLGVVGNTILLNTNYTVPNDGLIIPQRGSGNGDQTDYRIISVPLTLDTKTVKGVFEDDLGKYDPNKYRLFTYGDATTELTANSNLEVGKGYWLIVAGSDRAIDTGSGATVAASKLSPFTLQLNPGWNLIGNPYNFNISWADMQTANGALTESLRVFDGSFKNGTQLDAMGGGFVFADDTKSIGFPVLKNPTINSGRTKEVDNPNPREPLQPGDWEVALNLSQGKLSYNLGGIGMRTDAKGGYDQYDEMTLPRFVNYLEINHDKKKYGYPFSMDVTPIRAEQVWEFTIESAHAGNTTVSWNPAALSHLSNQLVLVDVDNQWPVDMTATHEYTFNSTGVRHFKAVYGNSDFIKKEISGHQFLFYGVHPNPATHDASITVSIPNPAPSSMMTVNLYSGLGQKVASYAYQIGNSGINEEQLPLHKSSLSPGIYIVQVQYGNIQKQTRLVIK